MLTLRDHEASTGLPDRSDPGAVATLVAEPPPAVAKTCSLLASENTSSPAVRVDAAPHWRPSTAILGGSFASAIFHLWLLAMLASLGIEKTAAPDEPAIDSSLSQE